MINRCIYELKLSSIVVLGAIQLSLIDTAPREPIKFFILSSILIISIRSLWRSILHNEKKAQAQRPSIRKIVSPKEKKESKRAA